MDRLKRWEIALMAGVMVTVLMGSWLSGEQQELAQAMIRLHVVANSDSVEDQALKLAVRDRVLEQTAALWPEGADPETAQEVLQEHLAAIEAAGRAVIHQWGKDDPITAQIGTCWFPTKQYGDISLPAGEYTALRLVIGDGGGQNWWCVVFPPLCLNAAGESLDAAAVAGYLTQEQTALVTGSEGYVLKFKCMEWLGQLKELLH